MMYRHIAKPASWANAAAPVLDEGDTVMVRSVVLNRDSDKGLS